MVDLYFETLRSSGNPSIKAEGIIDKLKAGSELTEAELEFTIKVLDRYAGWVYSCQYLSVTPRRRERMCSRVY